ncbi:MAG: hypothetical protein KC994_10415 [Candidatus Omnitrophica bacterium]|nr:hypothetical protein [Candidatus Omnitrophota bacterium]
MISISGFLPANQRSKTTLCQTWFRTLEVDVKEFAARNEGSLPESWDDLLDPEKEGETQYLMDPFAGFQSRLKARFEEDRIIFWSVGPDETDSLKIEGAQIERDDELVLVLSKDGDLLEGRMKGFLLQNGE